MLHPAEATWTPSGDGYARLSASPELDRQLAAGKEAIAVSSTQATALFEQQSKPAFGHASVQPGGQNSGQPAALYSMDTAMMGLALIGAWMMVVGGAMLSRRMSQLKAEPLRR